MEPEKSATSKVNRDKAKRIVHALAASRHFRRFIVYISLLVCFGAASLITGFSLDHRVEKLTTQQKITAVWNWPEESFRLSVFGLLAVCIFLILDVFVRLFAMIYSSVARKTFAKNVSREFKIHQYLLLEEKIRNFLALLLIRFAFSKLFSFTTQTKEPEIGSSAGSTTEVPAVSSPPEKSDEDKKLGLEEILRISDHVTNILQILEKYPSNLAAAINFLFTYSILMIAHCVLMRIISIKFHTSHFKERIEANDYMLNIFEALKKHAKKSKKTTSFFSTVLSSAEQLSPEANPLASPIFLAGPEAGGNSFANNTVKKYSDNSVVSEIARSRAWANTIFEMLCALKPARECAFVVAEDLVGLISVAEAKKFFPLLTLDHSPNLTRAEFCQAIENIYQQKHDIINSLCDHSVIIDKIDLIFHIIFLILCILLTLPSLFIILIAFSIVFITILESFLRKMCKCAIFVIVTHAYDIGDYIVVQGERFKVKEIHLLTTVFVSVEGEIVYYNNIELAKANITNIRRSPSQKETILLFVHPSTKIEQLDKLKAQLLDFVAAHSREFEGQVSVSDYELVNDERMQVKIGYTHKANFQDLHLYKHRKSLFQKHLWQLLQSECPIRLAPPTFGPNQRT